MLTLCDYMLVCYVKYVLIKPIYTMASPGLKTKMILSQNLLTHLS